MNNKTTYYHKIKKLLARTKEYYDKNRERLQEQAKNKYRILSSEKNPKERIWKLKICLK